MRKLTAFTLLLMFSLSTAKTQEQAYPFMDHKLSLNERLDDLVGRLTLKEKVDQLMYTAPAIERLGIPEYNWWNESLHGVARAGYATVFPQSITIAGSWDKDLMYRVATVISDEARAKHHEFVRQNKRGIYQGLTFWSPNINIFRDPRWGRGHETYGEDPYLTGQIGVQFVKGLQGDDPDYLKVVATAKHYAVHSGPEPLRHSFDAIVNERDFRETYMPAFRTLVKDGGVHSVMCAYNRYCGDPACANKKLNDILREEWGFEGYVVSDCWAIFNFFVEGRHGVAADMAEASAMAVKGGTDLNCGASYPALMDAVERGLITEEEIDVSVRRLFHARMLLGMFDPEEEVAYARIPFSVNGSDIHGTLAREAARKSIILLKNKNDILPLDKSIGRIAVIGPNADNWESLIGNYNGMPKDPVTVLEGLKRRLEPEVEVRYAAGSHLADGIHNLLPVPSVYLQTEDGRQGIKGEYFANSKLEGEPAFTRIDDQVNFYWESSSPSPDLPDDDFSVRWTGYIVPPVTGTYHIGCWGMPELEVFIDGKRILRHNTEHHAFHHEHPVEMEAGKKYKVTYEYRNWYGDGDARLLWSVPDDNMLGDAVSLAKDSDAVILVLGLSQRLEGEEMPISVDGFEGGDRTHLNLPGTQLKLIEALKSTGTPLIMVLLNGSALSITDEAGLMDAIISAGYPGQEGGTAVADVLFGHYNPAGRLPVTYYRSADQLPDFENYDMEGRTYRYFRGAPLYPFGFGLSYTNFRYSDLKFSERIAAGGEVEISVLVTNTGSMDGDEVVQLYLTQEKGSTPRPIRQLEGFERIHLRKGESRRVTFTLDPYQLSMINNKDLRVIEPGWFSFSVGGKQPGFSGEADASTTDVVNGRFRVTGRTTRIEQD
jgi:beta-glucosidase